MQTRRLSTQKGIALLTTPRTTTLSVYLFISGQEKSELWISFKLTSNSVMFHIAIAIYHTWMAVYIIVFV